MKEIRPPEVLGMKWTPSKDPLILRTDYRGAAATAMSLLTTPAGMTVEVVEDKPEDGLSGSSGRTSIALRPALADQDELDSWAEAIVPRYEEYRRSLAKRNFDMCGGMHRAQVKMAREEAEDLLERWNSFVARNKRVREILAMEFIMPQQLKELQRAIKATKAKSEALLIEHRDRQPEGVDWPDEDVERAIRVLTEADADHAGVVNSKGWGRSHSSLGHWCYGMLQSDRALAIKVGRGIVGTYRKQIWRAA